MKFSVVTLAFKQRDFLRQAIDSVLTQDYPDIEYIVVEPGSNDGSRELIEEYGDRIAHKIFEPDRGAADGLNKGIRQGNRRDLWVSECRRSATPSCHPQRGGIL